MAPHCSFTDFGTFAYPYPGKSTKYIRSLTRKKLIAWVRPGDELVRASPRLLVSVFNKVDLPIFDRPQKAISGLLSRGKSSGRVALLTNRAELIFTLQGGPQPRLQLNSSRILEDLHCR